jgi:hypothetical protein
MFWYNQQTHQLLSIYYFTLLLLHVSATVCHPLGARLYLLSYVLIWVLVDKIVCSMWLCVCYVTLRFVMFRYVMLHYLVLYYVMLCYVMLCYVMLCYVTR